MKYGKDSYDGSVSGIVSEDEISSGTGIEGNAVVSMAFVQVGYLLVGYNEDGDTLFNDDVLYGNFYDDGINILGGGLQLNVFADDLGGGMYAGVQVMDGSESDGGFVTDLNADGNSVAVAGIIGIGDQPWGGADLSAAYDDTTEEFLVKRPATSSSPRASMPV
ncbi:hypothetical protein A6302_00198 [Methylobrevis pamukkalensis]|uniref:Porin n=1 Tax=Methylobrevis pamukkalensis TaxID=1439726 RepID=A0A1E3H801_9HYPH|nr:hypothetical protein A6302_00198 [Methylobrevis pamukkalensis]